jgi:hypothetical protein
MDIQSNRIEAFGRLRGWQALGALLVAAVLAACGSPRTSMVAQEGASSRAPAPALAAVNAESTLGTQWGEGRESAVRFVEATRLSPDRPQALAQMRYSDEASIRQALGQSADRQLNVLLAGGDVEWSVQDGQGRPLPIFSARGGQDYLVAGRSGERYELVYVNRGNRDYEVVATVDGLDVLTGQAGSLRNGGHLLYPGQTLRIDGFRKSQSEVAAFRFSAKDRAYAGNTPAGDARNVGVIGSALFEVRVNDPGSGARPPRAPQAQPGSPNPFPGDPARPYAPPPQYRR